MTRKSIIKSVLCAVLSMCFLCSAGVMPSYAQESADDIVLYDIYGDSMLFLQNAVAELAGVAPSGTKLSCTLTSDDNAIVASGETVAQGGTFTLCFPTPSGSFSEYTLQISANGKPIAVLRHIVFGELWLASGQSNMEYPLSQEYDFRRKAELPKNAEYLRIMLCDSVPTCGHDTAYCPATEQENYLGCRWVSAADASMHTVSAVGYYFVAELMQSLQVPVGILNVSLGGSSIRSWISRTTLTENEQALAYLKRSSAYIAPEQWNPETAVYQTDMSAIYNARIYPLRHFRLSGMIWYQGESDLMFDIPWGEYSNLFTLMQKEYTELFRHEEGLLPIVYTQIVSFGYTNRRPLQDFNFELSQMQLDVPDSRATVSVSDAPLNYVNNLHQIHPVKKQSIARRMATAAQRLVYGKGGSTSSPALLSSKADGNSILATLANVGDGLVAKGKTLLGFTVCGADGVFYPAEAEIIAGDTVRITSEQVQKPVAAAYGFSQVNSRANLYASANGAPAFPASPFVTAHVENANYMPDYPWSDCESERMWLNIDNGVSGYYPIWNTENCLYILSDTAAYRGDTGLRITPSAKAYSLSQDFVKSVRHKQKEVASFERDLTSYAGFRFYARCDADTDAEIRFDGLRIACAGASVVYPAVAGTDCTTAVIPADGKWHEVVLDFSKLYRMSGTLCGDNRPLSQIKGFSLEFSSDSLAQIQLDEIGFVSSVRDSETTPQTNRLANRIRLWVQRASLWIKQLFGFSHTFDVTFENCTAADDSESVALQKNSLIQIHNAPIQRFNQYAVKYTADTYLHGVLSYSNGIRTVKDDFYLEPAEQPTVFTCFLSGSMDGKVGFRLQSITLSPCVGDTASFCLYDVSTRNQPLPDDEVFIENEQIKVGASLKWGGALSYFEDLDSNVQAVRVQDGTIKVDSDAAERYGKPSVNDHVNLINRHDTGRLVQQSYYGTGDCEAYRSETFMEQSWRYNPVQGGNQYNESARIIDFKVTDNSLYIKCQPLDWAKKAEDISPSYMEATYTLQGSGLRVDCRFVDFSGYPAAVASQELPAFYPIAPFDTLVYYGGDAPFTGEPPERVEGLIFWPDAGYPKFDTKEGWSAFVGEFEDSYGLGLYSPTSEKVCAGVYDRGKTVNAQPDLDGATSYIAIVQANRFESFRPTTYSFVVSGGTTQEMQRYFFESAKQFR